MCQLLGMNCNTPTDICFSFSGFQSRGGLTDVHSDGWGIAFFEGKGVRQFLDPQPSHHSPVAEFVRTYPIQSKSVIAHIRKATQGEVSLENTHPFQRQLWGYYWVFAHNGNVESFKLPPDGVFEPVGNTDSEKIFCWIMESLRQEFGQNYPGAEKVFGFVHRLTLQLAAQGEVNFLFSNGDFLMAHCSTSLSYVLRRAPFTTARLKDQELSVDFGNITTASDKVAVIATVPLTENETWSPLIPGHLVMFQNGDLVAELATLPWEKKSNLKEPHLLQIFNKTILQHQLPTEKILKEHFAVHPKSGRKFNETLNLNSLQDFFPEVKEVCDSLTKNIGHKVTCNVYVSAKNTKGLPLHYDLQDVIIYQAEGQKLWKLWKKFREQISLSTLATDQPAALEEWAQISKPKEIIFSKGNSYFIEAGTPHIAETTEQSSLHFTFAIHKK